MGTKNQEEIEVLEEKKVKRPSRYNVIFLNDNYTPMEFVIALLMDIFNKNEAEALVLTSKVHHQGKAIVGTYIKDIAQTKTMMANKAAKDNQFPLKVIMEAE